MDIKNVMHVSFFVCQLNYARLTKIFQIINYDLPSAEHGGIDEYVHRIGRTARIGNLGRATSFYNDRDAGLAQNLVKVLLECNQDIPDFLKEFQPEDKVVTWDDDTDDEGFSWTWRWYRRCRREGHQWRLGRCGWSFQERLVSLRVQTQYHCFALELLTELGSFVYTLVLLVQA